MTQLASAPSNIVPDDDLPSAPAATKPVPMGDLHPQHIQAMAVPDDDLPSAPSTATPSPSPSTTPQMAPPTPSPTPQMSQSATLAAPQAAPQTAPAAPQTGPSGENDLFASPAVRATMPKLYTTRGDLSFGNPQYPGVYRKTSTGFYQPVDKDGKESGQAISARDYEVGGSAGDSGRPAQATYGATQVTDQIGDLASGVVRGFSRRMGNENAAVQNVDRLIGTNLTASDQYSGAGKAGNFIGETAAPQSAALMAATAGIGEGIAPIGSGILRRVGANSVAGGAYTGVVGTASRAGQGETPTLQSVIKDVLPGAVAGGVGVAGGTASAALTHDLSPTLQTITRLGAGASTSAAANVAAAATAAKLQGQPYTMEDAEKDAILGVAAWGGSGGALHDLKGSHAAAPEETPAPLRTAAKETVKQAVGGANAQPAAQQNQQQQNTSPEIHQKVGELAQRYPSLNGQELHELAREFIKPTEDTNEHAAPAPAADTGAAKPATPAPTEAPGKAQVGSGVARVPGGDTAQRVAEAKTGETPTGGNGLAGGQVDQENVTNFKTALGSTYAVDERGNTTRTKQSPGRGQGEVHDQSPAVFISPKGNEAIMEEARGMGRVILASQKPDGSFEQVRPKQGDDIRSIPNLHVLVTERGTGNIVAGAKATTEPEVGKHPFEIHYKNDDKVYHMGNAITEVSRNTKEASPPTQNVGTSEQAPTNRTAKEASPSPEPPAKATPATNRPKTLQEAGIQERAAISIPGTPGQFRVTGMDKDGNLTARDKGGKTVTVDPAKAFRAGDSIHLPNGDAGTIWDPHSGEVRNSKTNQMTSVPPEQFRRITPDSLGLKPGDFVDIPGMSGVFRFDGVNRNGRFNIADVSTGRFMPSDAYRVKPFSAEKNASLKAQWSPTESSQASPKGPEAQARKDTTPPAQGEAVNEEKTSIAEPKPATITPEGAANAGTAEGQAKDSIRGLPPQGGGRGGEQAAPEGIVRPNDEGSVRRSPAADRRAASVEGIKRGIAPFKGVSLHDDGTNLHLQMPDGKKVRYNLVDRIAPVAHDIIDFLKSAIAANKGRWFTERGSEYAIPQDQEGWNKLPDSEKRVILDTFRTHGQYSRADDSITTTHQVAHDHSIAGEEVFHALSRRLKDADRDTYNRMMTKYDSEDAAFHDFQTSKSRAEYFKRIREGTAHESPSARAGDKYLSPKQKAEATLLSAAQDAGVLMSEHEFESFVNDRGGLHPDVLDDYKLRDANGKPRLNGDGEQMYTKEGNILKNFVNEGAHSDIAKDMSPAESDRYQQRIVNELLMTKAEKVRMAAEHFQSNPYAHPELKDAAEKILGKQEPPAEENEPAPFATRRKDEEEEKTTGPQQSLLGERHEGSGIGSKTGNMFGDTSKGPANAIEDTRKATPTDKDQGSLFATRRRTDEDEHAPTFFSHAERTIEDKLPNRADKAQIMKTLFNSGVKPDEMKWSGLDDYLAKATGPISKADLLEHIRANNVKLEEVTKSGQSTPADGVEQFGGGSTKFGQYQLPGGENYHEMLMKTPTKGLVYTDENVTPIAPHSESVASRPDLFYYFRTPDNVLQIPKSRFSTETAAKEYVIREKQPSPDAASTFKSSHWDEPNVLAHVRFNDRTGPNGEKMLHLEEVQSDWHQAGRDKGYRGENEKRLADLLAKRDALPHGEDRDAVQSEINKMGRGDMGVPDAPFKKTWHELALRRMLRMAAEGGYDKLSWTPGEEQNKRYDLSKQVDTLHYKDNGDGTHHIEADLPNGGQHDFGNIASDKLADHVGKDVAQKIIEGRGGKSLGYDEDNAHKFLKGVDLKVGGSGMKGFYDKIIPDYLNKYGKKWGAKVGETQIGVGKDNAAYDAAIRPEDWESPEAERLWRERSTATKSVHYIDITPSMKKSVLEEGQNLFATRRRTESEQSEIPKEQEKPEDQDTRPDPTLFGQYDKSPTSIKNAVVDEERAKRGLPPMMDALKRSYPDVAEEANREIDRDPKVQDRLIADLKEKPRPLTDKENYFLLQRRADLYNQRDDVAKRMTDAKASNDDAEVATQRVRAADVSDQLLELEKVIKEAGTENARGLAARRMMMNEDYSLAAMENRKRIANGGRQLTPEESDHIKELQAKIAETQKKFDDYVKQNENRARRVRAKDATAKVIASASSPRRPLAVLDAEESSILAGLRQRVASLRDTMGGGQFAVRGEGEDSEPTSAHAQDTGPGTDWSTIPNLSKIVQALAKNQVERGVRDRDALVDAVHGKLKDVLDGFTKDDVVDAISGYGKYRQLSKDEISVTLRDLKGQLQQEAKLRDMTEKGLAPLKTGVERRAPSDEERRLIQQVNDTKKKLGISATDPETELKGALDGVKTRLKNQISDLDYQIARGEKTVREKSPSPTDAEADALRAKRDDLKKQYDAMFTDPKMSDEDRIKVAMRAAEKSLATYEQRLKDNLPFDAKKPVAPTSPELEAVRARRDAAKDQLEHLQAVAGVDAVNARKQQLAEKQIAEVERKIREKELVAAKTPAQSTPELDALNAHRNVLQKTLDKIRADAAKKPPSQIDAEKQAARVKQLQESIAKIGQKISDKTPATPQAKVVESPEIEALKKQRSLLAQSLMKIRNEAKPRKTPEEIALKAFKTRTTNRIAELTERLAKKDYGPSAPRRRVALDTEAMTLEADKNRFQQQFQQELMRNRLNKRSTFEKVMDATAKWSRTSILSSPGIILKLANAAALRGITSPMEEAVGGVLSHVIPGVASRAPREGGFSTKAEARAITEGITTGIKQGWKVMKTGHSDLDAIFGKKGHLPHSYLDYVTDLHGALHTPTQYSEFARSLQKRTEFAIRAGLDPTEPATQLRLMNESYKDSLRSVFRQDNMVTDAFNRAMSRFGQTDKTTGHATVGGKVAETAAKVALPVTRVPTNIATEVFQYATGAATGSARLAKALSAGLDKLKPEEADIIMRSLKKGSIGLAVMGLGYFGAGGVGGFYQRGEKRDKDDVAAGDVKVSGVTIPHQYSHHPLTTVLQMGATVRRVADSFARKSDEQPQGLGEGAMAAAVGAAEDVPFINETTEINKVLDPKQRDRAIGDRLRSAIVPQLVSRAAQFFDKDEQGNTVPRKPTGVFENLETGIPFLRQNVPTDDKKARELANR